MIESMNKISPISFHVQQKNEMEKIVQKMYSMKNFWKKFQEVYKNLEIVSVVPQLKHLLSLDTLIIQQRKN